MSQINGRHSPSGFASGGSTPIETKEDIIEVRFHGRPAPEASSTPVANMRTRAARAQLVQAPDQPQAQAPEEDHVHGCGCRGCWSCVGCACFAGFLGAIVWARKATGH